MMNFWMFVGAMIAANVIMTVIAFAAFSTKAVRKWYMNYCSKVSKDLVDLMEEMEED